jgi:hypothetical protein
MEYLRVDRLCPLILSANGSGVLIWYVDASFAVYPNMRSQTGGGLTMGRGFPIVSSTKQKLNTQSSTESELVGVDDMMPIVVWSWYFLMAEGYGVTQNCYKTIRAPFCWREMLKHQVVSGLGTSIFNISSLLTGST